MSSELTLRAIEPIDADLLYRVENDEVAWAGSDTIAPYSRKILRDYALNYDADPFSAGQLRFIVENRDRQPIGILDLYEISALHRRAFIGIYVLPENRGKGFGKEIITMAVAYARKHLNIINIAARIIEQNQISLKAFQSAGFQQTALLPRWHFSNGQYHNVALLLWNDI